MCWTSFRRSVQGVKPNTETCPLVGCRMPVRILIVFDLAAPLGPMKATDCPAGTSSEIPSTAVTGDVLRRNHSQRTRANSFLRSRVWTPQFISSLHSNRVRPKPSRERLLESVFTLLDLIRERDAAPAFS